MMHARAALPVERLAAGVADRVDAARLAERLQVPVDGGQPDGLALAPQFRVDLLGAAEARQALQRDRQRLRLPRPARPGPARRLHLRGLRAPPRLDGLRACADPRWLPGPRGLLRL